jgi:hypothetical protein
MSEIESPKLQAAMEDLRVVRRMIDETRSNVGRTWFVFALFGVLGVIASFVSHVLVSRTPALVWIPWAAFAVLGLIGNCPSSTV